MKSAPALPAQASIVSFVSTAAKRYARALSLLVVFASAACSDLPTDPLLDSAAGEPSLNTTVSPLEMWWPTENAVFSGLQIVQGKLTGYSLDQYAMYWSVDGGSWVWMENSWWPSPHKMAYLNADGWSWNGKGPYRITFHAVDRQGRVLAERSTLIYLEGYAATEEPPLSESGNPFLDAELFVDPYSKAQLQMNAWASTRPEDANLIERIAKRSNAVWIGDWYSDVYWAVAEWTTTITNAGALPVYVAYNIPVRDCGSYSAGGASSAAAYRSWIDSFASALAGRKAVVILEPDALAGMDCLSETLRAERIELLRYAVGAFKANPQVFVYIDAGNPGWHGADAIAARLTEVNVGAADGFALNVSNYFATNLNVDYGLAVSDLLDGKHFVVDTSRNGLGPSDPYEWCNPSGRALGTPPTTNTASDRVDAYLWVKHPGESDGTCNGGPGAGEWWADYALGLAQRMPESLASLD